MLDEVIQPVDLPRWQERLDSVVMHPVIGLIALFTILLVIFQAVFAWAEPVKDLITLAKDALSETVSLHMPAGVLKNFLIQGLIEGVGAVVVFLPQIIILFFFILVLEDTGYLTRAAFLLDRPMQEKQAQQAKAQSKIGEIFLAENAKKDGITVTESGLQYEIITTGTGTKPTAQSRVKTHYHGTLIDGTVFDSSVQRGEPIDFPVGGVIAGWTEALQLMPVGSKWRLYIPHNLAYGERGAGPTIAPYSALIFDVELLDIVG